MYLVIIKTKYNVIRLTVDDYNSSEVQEIFNQPYVEEIRIEQAKQDKSKKLKL